MANKPKIFSPRHLRKVLLNIHKVVCANKRVVGGGSNLLVDKLRPFRLLITSQHASLILGEDHQPIQAITLPITTFMFAYYYLLQTLIKLATVQCNAQCQST